MNPLPSILDTACHLAALSDNVEHPPATRFVMSQPERDLFDFLAALPDADKKTLLALYWWGMGDCTDYQGAVQRAEDYPLLEMPAYLGAKLHLHLSLRKGAVLLKRQERQSTRQYQHEEQARIRQHAEEARQHAEQAVLQAQQALGQSGVPGPAPTLARSLEENRRLRDQALTIRQQSRTLRAFHYKRRLKQSVQGRGGSERP